LGFGKALRLLVFNYKGGCGKSTIVANLGASLAWSKKKVLLIDGDAQCNLTSFYKGNDNANIITEADYSDIIIESVLNHMKGSEGKILSDDLSDDVHASDMKAYIR
jgi:cellulose biosynthesis protein BcsQ